MVFTISIPIGEEPIRHMQSIPEPPSPSQEKQSSEGVVEITRIFCKSGCSFFMITRSMIQAENISIRLFVGF